VSSSTVEIPPSASIRIPVREHTYARARRLAEAAERAVLAIAPEEGDPCRLRIRARESALPYLAVQVPVERWRELDNLLRSLESASASGLRAHAVRRGPEGTESRS
jgi:hypothetical protein